MKGEKIKITSIAQSSEGLLAWRKAGKFCRSWCEYVFEAVFYLFCLFVLMNAIMVYRKLIGKSSVVTKSDGAGDI